MKSKSDLLNDLTPQAYLELLVKKTTHLNYLSQFKDISLCGIDMSIQIMSGIEELATVADKKINITYRDDKFYPLRLNFTYKDIEFFQLQQYS